MFSCSPFLGTIPTGLSDHRPMGAHFGPPSPTGNSKIPGWVCKHPHFFDKTWSHPPALVKRLFPHLFPWEEALSGAWRDWYSGGPGFPSALFPPPPDPVLDPVSLAFKVLAETKRAMHAACQEILRLPVTRVVDTVDDKLRTCMTFLKAFNHGNKR